MHDGYPNPFERVSFGGSDFSFRDVSEVVDAFYRKVEKDPTLSVPFRSVEDWPHHISRLTHFWWVRIGGERYLPGVYNPVEKHFLAGFNQEFLERWLMLFQETLTLTLRPDQAKAWGLLADRMGMALSIKNEMYRDFVLDRKE